jgi:hypothetical protein
VPGYGVDDSAGPFLAARQEVEEPAEGAEQHHTDGGGHHHQDRRRAVSVQPGRYVEPVEDQEGHQGEPEDDVQDDGGADPLGAEGEPGVGAGDPGLGEQAVAECRPGGCPTWRDVAQRQGRQVDPEEPEALRPALRQHRMGEQGVGAQGGDLEQDAEGQVGHVDVGEGPYLAAVVGHHGQNHVEAEQEDQDRAHAQADVTAHEGSLVPPPVAWGSVLRTSLRPVCRRRLHRPHVGTARPVGPAMLNLWPTLMTNVTAVWRLRRPG